MFLFKKKKLIVDTFISEINSGVHKYAPIDYARNFYPDWWKAIPKSTHSFESMQAELTIKTCPGFIKHYTHGLMIPMWSDVMLSSDDTSWKYQFSDNRSFILYHNDSQRGDFYKNHFNVKLISPWLIQSEKDMYFNFLPAFYDKPEPQGYIVMPGTVKYDIQPQTNINLLLPHNTKSLIQFNQPLVQLVPLTNREIEVRNHLVQDTEWQRISNKYSSFTFSNTYTRVSAIERKCPFRGK